MKTFVVLAGAALSALVLVFTAQAQTAAQPDAARLQLAREILTANGGAQAAQSPAAWSAAIVWRRS
jgi:hypothetical protein